MRRSIQNQVVVITGASSGIGRCTALHLASRGAKIVATARRADALGELVEEIHGRGGRAIAVPADVTRKAELREVARAATDRFGRIDTWVNNASVYIQGRVQDISLDEFRRILDVVVIGTVNGTQCALEDMLPRRSGVIVQVSSITARRGVAYTTPYSAAKAALDGFCSALRAELWGSGVRVSVLYPPTVDTPIYRQARAKLGVIPKPAPPMSDPIEAARTIERLAITGRRYGYFGWARPLAMLDMLAPPVADWLMHHGARFTYSDRPASPRDNLLAPSTEIPATIRDGWSEPGWRGLTAHEVIRALPVESALAAAALGFLAARAMPTLRSEKSD